MVFSEEDKAIIKHYFDDKGKTAYSIWKDNPERNWDKRSVAKLIERYVKTGTMDRKPGSGRPRRATAEVIEEVEELICSQEEPGTHVPPRTIAPELDIS
jgi:hypothetical protein